MRILLKQMHVKKWQALRMNNLRDESGSLSVLIIGLFILTVALIMVMTNVSSLVLAKKALTQKTEFLAQQGAQEIDLEAYYTGTGGLLPYVAEKLFVDQTDPGIPLDCKNATSRVINASSAINDPRLKNFELVSYQCSGGTTYVETKADAVLPYDFGIFQLIDPVIHGYASSAPERRNGFWIRGLRLW